MARRPLYPNLPGEQALDRLLNQTLPNLVQQREAKIQREEDIRRQDRIRDIKKIKIELILMTKEMLMIKFSTLK
jgi:hypothetical protein